MFALADVERVQSIVADTVDLCTKVDGGVDPNDTDEEVGPVVEVSTDADGNEVPF